MEPSALERFTISRWLRSPHLQTFGAAAPLFCPPPSHASAPTEELRIPLLGARDADPHHVLHARAWWVVGRDGERQRRPVVVLVHGIGGSSLSKYVVRTGVALHRAGYHVVRLDLRGAGASTPDVPSLYHAGLSDDLARVTRHLAREADVDGVVLFGFSGGGSIALKLAGEHGAAPLPDLRAIVSVSAPLDFTKVVAWMDTLRRLPYRFHVLRGLSNGARAFAAQHPSRAHYRPEDVKRLSSFRYYDASIIVPMHGFDDVDDYYVAASPGRLLPQITVPTLLVHAEDDPMVPRDSVVPWLAGASSAVDVALSPLGGHLGWVSGLDEASWIESWPARRALGFLRDKVPFDAERG